MRTSRRWMTALLAALLAPGTAAAVEPLDRFSFSIGTYLTRFDTQLRADGETGRGTRVDLRRDFGLDPEARIAFAGLTWRPFDRHEFGVGYFADSVEADRRLQRDIVFEDKVYEAASTVHARYDLDSIEAYYVWWAFSEDTWALGPRVGLTWYQVDFGLKATLQMDGTPATGELEEHYKGDLPAPTIGAGWRWTPARDWRVSADAGWLSTEVNGIDADIGYGRVGLEWHPRPRFGVLLDYSRFQIDASTRRRDFTGHLRMHNSGLRLGLVFRY